MRFKYQRCTCFHSTDDSRIFSPQGFYNMVAGRKMHAKGKVLYFTGITEYNNILSSGNPYIKYSVLSCLIYLIGYHTSTPYYYCEMRRTKPCNTYIDISYFVSNYKNSEFDYDGRLKRVYKWQWLQLHKPRYKYVLLTHWGRDKMAFPADMFKRIFVNENISISIRISLKFVLEGPILRKNYYKFYLNIYEYHRTIRRETFFSLHNPIHMSIEDSLKS